MLSERAGEEFLARVSSVIELRLKESGIEGATIKRRVKSIYGIYRKTIMQNKSFVRDLRYLRGTSHSGFSG